LNCIVNFLARKNWRFVYHRPDEIKRFRRRTTAERMLRGLDVIMTTLQLKNDGIPSLALM